MARTRLHHWLWDNQMRRLPRAIVGLVAVAWVAVAVGVAAVVAELVGGAA